MCWSELVSSRRPRAPERWSRQHLCLDGWLDDSEMSLIRTSTPFRERSLTIGCPSGQGRSWGERLGPDAQQRPRFCPGDAAADTQSSRRIELVPQLRERRAHFLDERRDVPRNLVVLLQRGGEAPRAACWRATARRDRFRRASTWPCQPRHCRPLACGGRPSGPRCRPAGAPPRPGNPCRRRERRRSPTTTTAEAKVRSCRLKTAMAAVPAWCSSGFSSSSIVLAIPSLRSLHSSTKRTSRPQVSSGERVTSTSPCFAPLAPASLLTCSACCVQNDGRGDDMEQVHPGDRRGSRGRSS